MTNSKNSSNQRATKGRGPKREKAAPGTTDLDRPLKLASAHALASAGLYVRTNVVLSEPRADVTRGGKWASDITDVDVLSVAHSLDLSADIACMACKGGTSVSVLHETFALAGVMRYLHARRGYAVFSKKATESHMLALAEQLNISLMDEAEWSSWCSRVAGPYPVPRTFEDDVDAEVGGQLQRRSDLEGLLRYLRTEFWYYRDYRNVQTMVAQLRRASDKFNDSPLMRFVLLDACSLFALAVLQLCEHVNTAGLSRLTETAPPFLFGGIQTYRNRRELLKRVEELLQKKNVLDASQGLPSLDPPYLPELLEIVLRWCSKPAAAARVPQCLSVRAGESAAEAAGKPGDARQHGESDLTEKLALDLVAFVADASKLMPGMARSPRGAWSREIAPSIGVERTASDSSSIPTANSSRSRAAAEQGDLLRDSSHDGDRDRAPTSPPVSAVRRPSE